MAYTAEQLQTMIDEAEAAYRKIIMGQASRVIVDGGNGDRVEFAPADKQRLYMYIQDLRAQLAALSTSGASIPYRAPARILF